MGTEIPAWASEMRKGQGLPGGPVLWVSRKEVDWAVLWKTRLCNDISPVSLLVADSGQYVVTFDNWHSVGYGSNVVVFYGNGRLLKSYSLEELVRSQGVNVVDLVDRRGLDAGRAEDVRFAMWQLFPHSVSSRDWRTDDITLLDESAEPPSVGMFLPWVRRWMVFSFKDGEPVTLTAEVQRHWRELGRNWAVPALESCLGAGGDKPAVVGNRSDSKRLQDGVCAMKFLALTGEPPDRPLLEQAVTVLQDNPFWLPRPHTVAQQALEVFDGTRRRFEER